MSVRATLRAFLGGAIIGSLLTLTFSHIYAVSERWITTRTSDIRNEIVLSQKASVFSIEEVDPVEDSDDSEGNGELLSVAAEEDANASEMARQTVLAPEETENVEQQIGFRPVMWEDVDDKYKLSEDRILAQKRLWREGKADKPLFFFYQPSGGWGNQRYQLMWAIIAANAMNRTLIVPPIGAHSSLWYNFNKWPAASLLPMARVLNMEALNRVVTRGVISFNDTTGSLQRYLPRLNILSYRRPEDAGWWSFQKIRADWNKREYFKYDVIFWEKDSMWCCCGASGPFKDYYSRHVMFNNHIKQLARRLIRAAVSDPVSNPNATYHAVHVRRGDHVTGDRKTPMKYYRDHELGRFDKRFPLYIATDEKNQTWFEMWKQPRYKMFSKMLFWKDLPQDLIANELKFYPKEMHGDVAGFLEMMICAFARRWEGSRGSTFSAAIARTRIRKELRVVKFDWPSRPTVSE